MKSHFLQRLQEKDVRDLIDSSILLKLEFLFGNNSGNQEKENTCCYIKNYVLAEESECILEADEEGYIVGDIDSFFNSEKHPYSEIKIAFRSYNYDLEDPESAYDEIVNVRIYLYDNDGKKQLRYALTADLDTQEISTFEIQEDRFMVPIEAENIWDKINEIIDTFERKIKH